MVECVLGSRQSEGREKEYLIKWVGYDEASDNTWEPASNINDPRLIANFAAAEAAAQAAQAAEAAEAKAATAEAPGEGTEEWPGCVADAVIAGRLRLQKEQESKKRARVTEAPVAVDASRERKRARRQESKTMPSGDNILRLNRDAIAKAGLPPIGREGVTLLRVNEKYQRPAEHANMNLSAAIADGWAGSTTSTKLADYLRRLGFNVTLDQSAEQHGFTCGLVASRWILDKFVAEQDCHTSLARAVELRWLAKANRELELFSEEELSGSVSLREGAHRCANGEPTRYLDGAEVAAAARLFWEPIAERLDASESRGQFERDCDMEWLGVESLDSAIAVLATDLALAKTGAPVERFLVVNDAMSSSDASGGGTHWFPVTWSIIPPAMP